MDDQQKLNDRIALQIGKLTIENIALALRLEKELGSKKPDLSETAMAQANTE